MLIERILLRLKKINTILNSKNIYIVLFSFCNFIQDHTVLENHLMTFR